MTIGSVGRADAVGADGVVRARRCLGLPDDDDDDDDDDEEEEEVEERR